MLPGQSPNGLRNPGMALSDKVADIGYEPDHSIESGVASYIEWLRNKFTITNPILIGALRID